MKNKKRKKKLKNILLMFWNRFFFLVERYQKPIYYTLNYIYNVTLSAKLCTQNHIFVGDFVFGFLLRAESVCVYYVESCLHMPIPSHPILYYMLMLLMAHKYFITLLFEHSHNNTKKNEYECGLDLSSGVWKQSRGLEETRIYYLHIFGLVYSLIRADDCWSISQYLILFLQRLYVDSSGRVHS